LQSVLTNVETIDEVVHDDEEKMRDKMIDEQSSEICSAVSVIDAISLFDVLKNFVFSHTMLLYNKNNN